ncbi:MAG: PA2779 family protein [Desulfuromonadales bacterium]
MSFFLVFSFLLLDFSVQAANAQMVDTGAVIAVQQEKANRERVAAFLGREDVQQVMIQHGVDAVEAQKRVDSLSNAELTKIANSMEQLPAGGDAVGAVVGAAVFIFVVLLITDLLGLTHVFSFVNAQN